MELTLKDKSINLDGIIGIIDKENKLLEFIDKDIISIIDSYNDFKTSTINSELIFYGIDPNTFKKELIKLNLDIDINSRFSKLSSSIKKIIKVIISVLCSKDIILFKNLSIELDNKNKFFLRQYLKNSKKVILLEDNINDMYIISDLFMIITDDINIDKPEIIIKNNDLEKPYLYNLVELLNNKGLKLDYSKNLDNIIKGIKEYGKDIKE